MGRIIMKINLFKLKKQLGEQGITFCYSGPVSKDLMNEISEVFEQKMKMEDVNRSTVGKVFSMIVEQIENIMKYSDEIITDATLQKELRVGIIVIGRCEDDMFFVMTGNIIHNHKVGKMMNKLTTIQQMNQIELKQYYKQQRRKDPDKDSKGAGLGFIELARRSSCPIEFNFEKIDEKASFFTITTKFKEN